MDKIIAFIILAVSILVTTTFIVAALSVMQTGTKLTRDGATTASQILGLEEATFATDLRGELSGATVKELMLKYADSGYFVQAVTKGNQNGFYGIDDIDNTTKDHYISDSVKFIANTVHNDNDAIIGVQFTQLGLNTPKFDQKEAESAVDTVEAALVKEQYSLFKAVNKYQGLCSECLKAFRAWSDSVFKLNSETLDLLQKTITNRSSDDSSTDYTTMTLLSKQKTEFLNTLANTIQNDWIANNWFDPLLYFINNNDDNDDAGDGTGDGGSIGGDDADDGPVVTPEPTNDTDVPKDEFGGSDSESDNSGDLVSQPTPEPTEEPTEAPVEPGEPEESEKPEPTNSIDDSDTAPIATPSLN